MARIQKKLIGFTEDLWSWIIAEAGTLQIPRSEFIRRVMDEKRLRQKQRQVRR